MIDDYFILLKLLEIKCNKGEILLGFKLLKEQELFFYKYKCVESSIVTLNSYENFSNKFDVNEKKSYYNESGGIPYYFIDDIVGMVGLKIECDSGFGIQNIYFDYKEFDFIRYKYKCVKIASPKNLSCLKYLSKDSNILDKKITSLVNLSVEDPYVKLYGYLKDIELIKQIKDNQVLLFYSFSICRIN